MRILGSAAAVKAMLRLVLETLMQRSHILFSTLRGVCGQKQDTNFLYKKKTESMIPAATELC